MKPTEHEDRARQLLASAEQCIHMESAAHRATLAIAHMHMAEVERRAAQPENVECRTCGGSGVTSDRCDEYEAVTCPDCTTENVDSPSEATS